jgi:hypothetical protein
MAGYGAAEDRLARTIRNVYGKKDEEKRARGRIKIPKKK